MNVKSILVLLLTLGWFALCNWWYCCKLTHACAGCAPTEEAATPPALVEGSKDPLLFEPSKSATITNDKFKSFKDGILTKKTDDNLLEITGYYYADEENTSSFDNLGMARADAVRKLFLEDIPEERIRIKSSLKEGKASDEGDLFSSVDFNWITPEIKTSEVIQLADRAIILFPSGSTRKEADPAIDEYLDKLAQRVKESGERIELTGHADNTGEETANLALGRQRALVIKNILVRKGVNADLISIDTKGESQPVASNDTEEGRHQNRRTVVRIVKSE